MLIKTKIILNRLTLSLRGSPLLIQGFQTSWTHCVQCYVSTTLSAIYDKICSLHILCFSDYNDYNKTILKL